MAPPSWADVSGKYPENVSRNGLRETVFGRRTLFRRDTIVPSKNTLRHAKKPTVPAPVYFSALVNVLETVSENGDFSRSIYFETSCTLTSRGKAATNVLFWR